MKTLLQPTLSAVLALVFMPGCATVQPAGECVVKEGKLLDTAGKPMTGCMMMLHGKMMIMDGKLKPITRNMTMPDGTVCMVNGVCVMKGGAKRQLKEGEVLSPAGKLFRAKGLSLPGAH